MFRNKSLSLIYLLKFVSHHLLIGFHHIFLPLPFCRHSVVMRSIVSLLDSYIKDKKLTILSHCNEIDNLELVPTIYGMEFHSHAIETIQSNLMLFLSKGLADYLVILNINDFLIPKVSTNINKLVARINSFDEVNAVANNIHPACFFQFKSMLNINSDEFVKSMTIEDYFIG